MRYLLTKGEVLTVAADDAIESITLTVGDIWLTRSSDTRDYCLEAGNRLPVVKWETLIIEALTTATLTINCRQCHAGLRITMACPRTSSGTV